MARLVQTHDILWWLAEHVLVHGRVPSRQAIQSRWTISRSTACHYRREALDRLAMRQAREGVHHE